MERAEVAVCTLLVIISLLLVFFLLKDRKEKKREIFSIEINSLITMIVAESCQAWGYSPSQRWWYIWRESFLKKKLSQYSACEEYISFSILSGKSWEKCKKLDFPAKESVEKFLNLRLKGVREYQELRNRTGRNFVQIDAFRGPRDVFLKVDGNECVFLFFDHLNFCTCSEVKVATEEIKKSLEQTQSVKEKKVFDLTCLFLEFESSSVEMVFFTPVGWLPASFSREDFERAFNEAQKS